MKHLQFELEIAKTAVEEALSTLFELRPEASMLVFDDTFPKELKAKADVMLEDVILKRLLPMGIQVLSEETGVRNAPRQDGSFRWVVDPLDGTVNFTRQLGSCAVSVALCDGYDPVLGVVGEFPSGKIAWGGRGFGAFRDAMPMHVSSVDTKDKAVLCTGFPSRFDFSEVGFARFRRRVLPYAKVRMMGAASISLLQVAKGAADVYAEQDIMLWDVAAGLALVQGAGGTTRITPGRFVNSFDVFAGNGRIEDD
jgi:myo-inositol-1(or 4)-monophosphatase